MSEHPTISHADLARYWGCSPANVSNLVKRKSMPAFTSLRAADEWRVVNAPLRKTRQSETAPRDLSSKNPVEVAKKTAASPATTTPAATSPQSGDTGEQLAIPGVEGGADRKGLRDRYAPPRETAPQRIDVSKFVDPAADFLDQQIGNAKELSQITYGLLKLKTQEGDPGAIAAAAKNWHETSKAAADVIEKFVAIQREASTLIPIDDVENVIATELEEIRKGLKRLGKRAAGVANPQDPALAERAIDAAVDQLLAAVTNMVDRTRIELTAEKDPSSAKAAAVSA